MGAFQNGLKAIHFNESLVQKYVISKAGMCRLSVISKGNKNSKKKVRDVKKLTANVFDSS